MINRMINDILMIGLILVVFFLITICVYFAFLYFYYSFRDILGIGKPQIKPFPNEDDKSKEAEKIRARQIIIDRIWDHLYNNPIIPCAISPFFIIILAAILGILITVKIEISYYVLMLFYITVYLEGMYRRYRYNRDIYQQVLEANIAFTKICFIPISFFISFLSFYISFDEWHIEGKWSPTITAKIWLSAWMDGIPLITDILLFGSLIKMLFVMVCIMIVFSMAAEYFVMKVRLYRFKYEIEYMEINNYIPVFKKQKRRFLEGYPDESIEQANKDNGSNKKG